MVSPPCGWPCLTTATRSKSLPSPHREKLPQITKPVLTINRTRIHSQQWWLMLFPALAVEQSRCSRGSSLSGNNNKVTQACVLQCVIRLFTHRRHLCTPLRHTHTHRYFPNENHRWAVKECMVSWQDRASDHKVCGRLWCLCLNETEF